MFHQVLNTLIPVFATIGLGYLLARKAFLSEGFFQELNRFVFRVALPAVIISKLSLTEALPSEALPMIAVFIASTSLLLLTGYLLMHLFGMEKWRRGTFGQAIFRGNLAFIGIPILMFATGNRPAPEVDAIITRSVLVFAPSMIFYNILSVSMLSISAEAGSSERAHVGRRFLQMGWSILKNPLIIASLIGLALGILPWPPPPALSRTLDYLGGLAGPAALLCVGGGMALTPLSDHWHNSLAAAVLKTGLLPLYTYFLASLFGFNESEMLTLLVFSAAPSAVAGYVMAQQMKGDAPMASGTIFFSTLLSLFSLGIIVAFYA